MDIDSGIIVGITPSDLMWDGQPFVPGDPGPNDLSAEKVFYDRATIYERWCYQEADTCGTDEEEGNLPGPPNDQFDLDFLSICFLPLEGGFEVSSAGAENPDFMCGPPIARTIPTLSQWGLIAMAGVLGIAGLIVMRRRKAAA